MQVGYHDGLKNDGMHTLIFPNSIQGVQLLLYLAWSPRLCTNVAWNSMLRLRLQTTHIHNLNYNKLKQPSTYMDFTSADHIHHSRLRSII